MSRVQDATPRSTVTITPSYFWSCLTLADECPFFSTTDPKLYYFGIALICFYGAFLLMILADLKFYLPLDNFQNQIDYYINLVRKKVRRVQRDQKRLSTIQERTEKQLTRSLGCRRVVAALRQALSVDSGHLNTLTRQYVDASPSHRSNCSIRPSFIDF